MIGRVAVFAALFVLATAAANAQVMSREAISLRNQILELQNQVNQLQQQVETNAGRSSGGSALGGGYRSSASPRSPGSSDLVVNLLQQVSSLQDQVRDLRGKVDELSNSTDREIADLNKKVGDLAFQLQLSQGKGTATPGLAGGTVTPPSANTSASVPPSGARPSAGVLLERGKTSLARSDYASAAAAATQILQTDAHSPMAYQAQILLAQALFGEKQYSRAALAYDDAYGRAPAGQYAQDSLLGLARSLERINQAPAACAAIAKLHKQFTNLRSDVAQGATALSHQAKCG